MATQVTVNVSLTPEWERFIAARVDSGRFESASPVVREGLRLLSEQDEYRQSALADARQKIAAGLDDAARGEWLDGEAVTSELLRRHQQRAEAEQEAGSG